MTFYSNPKQKSYILNPRGKPLFEDPNRFGTKMLEKMGWSKGKGLGANLDGEQNFIRVTHKTDQRGMGYQDRNDQWTSHGNDFNSLLKSLDDSKNVFDEECVEDDEEVEHRGFGFATTNTQTDEVNKKSQSVKASLSGKSLEEMSKQSNSRVHYRKFTRGKDISKYSEKDLASIFGKKYMDNDEKSISIEEQIENSMAIMESGPNFGVNIVETGTTIHDYFKKKENAKSKRPTNVLKIGEKKQKEKKKKKKKKKSTSCVEKSNIEKEEQCVTVAPVDQISKKIKKKKKRSNGIDCNMASVTEDEVNVSLPKSATYFVETILTTLANVNDPRNSSSTDHTNQSHYVNEKSETQLYEINQFQAEIFRFVDLNGFPNANLSDICGYGVAGNIDLKVTEKTRDRTKINDLWDDALVNKYGKDVFQAKKKKRYSIKALNKHKLFTRL